MIHEVWDLDNTVYRKCIMALRVITKRILSFPMYKHPHVLVFFFFFSDSSDVCFSFVNRWRCLVKVILAADSKFSLIVIHFPPPLFDFNSPCIFQLDWDNLSVNNVFFKQGLNIINRWAERISFCKLLIYYLPTKI